MSNDMPPSADHCPPALSDKALARLLSDCLKWVGFRPAAAIERATTSFTLADLKQALFPEKPGRSDAELTFITTAGHEAVRMYVTAIRETEFTGDSDFMHDLFPRRPEQRGVYEYWIIEGLLLKPDPDPTIPPGSYTFAIAEAYDDPGDLRGSPDPTLVPSTPEDAFLKVLAVIAYDKERRRIVAAVIQRLPSPADQILQIPPP